MTTAVVLDTDIGTDIDDTIALALLLGSPTLEPIGVITNYVDAPRRARLAAELLRRGGCAVPVWPGESVPVRPAPSLVAEGVWEWHEGRGVLYDDVTPEEQEYHDGRRPRTRPYDRSSTDGVDRLVAAIETHAPVTMLCIGPLTNLATLLERHPDVVDSIAAVTIMGGTFPDDADGPQAEHNFAADPGAVERVFASALPLTIVSFEATQLCYLERDKAVALCPAAPPMSAALGRLITVYFAVKDRWRTSMHDPVAVAITEDPSLTGLESTKVYLDAVTGATARSPFAGGVAREVALLRDLEVARCEALIYDRLRAACARHE
jgi:purine nucleosidase